MSSFVRLLPVLALASLLITVPAQADVQYAPTMLVLDASGSMKGAKMDAAKSAVHTFVDSAPSAAQVGLTVYGTHTGSSAAEKAAGCQDVEVLRQPGSLDKAALNAAVDGIQPSGYTPIGAALTKAAAALPTEGPRSIVLVSDGLDTCAPPDPCEVAKKLTQQGSNIVVHTVGYGVDASSRAQLTCIAQATGGTYSDAPDGKALERVLPRVSAVALRNYESAGVQITGTPGWESAPTARAGQSLDTIGQGETRYYAVEVPQGATAYFSGTLSFPRLDGVSETDDINDLQLRVYGENGVDCHVFESQQVTMSSDAAALTIAKTWDGATEPKGECAGGGRYYFAVRWDKVSAGVPERLPIELLVRLDAPVADPGPAGVLAKTAFVEPTAAAQPVTGGGSFNVAGTLSGSGRYTDTLQRGEFVFYRVRLDWGQGLAYRVHFGQTAGRGLDNLSNVSTTLYTPYRAEIDSATTSYTGADGVLPGDGAIATVPMRYANRATPDVRLQSVAGMYYIAVKVGATHDAGADLPVPVTLDITIAGSPGAVGAMPAGATAVSGSPLAWILGAIGAGLVVLAGLGILVRRRRA
jgi:Ca-activated chloride channel family protein